MLVKVHRTPLINSIYSFFKRQFIMLVQSTGESGDTMLTFDLTHATLLLNFAQLI